MNWALHWKCRPARRGSRGLPKSGGRRCAVRAAAGTSCRTGIGGIAERGGAGVLRAGVAPEPAEPTPRLVLSLWGQLRRRTRGRGGEERATHDRRGQGARLSARGVPSRSRAGAQGRIGRGRRAPSVIPPVGAGRRGCRARPPVGGRNGKALTGS